MALKRNRKFQIFISTSWLLQLVPNTFLFPFIYRHLCLFFIAIFFHNFPEIKNLWNWKNTVKKEEHTMGFLIIHLGNSISKGRDMNHAKQEGNIANNLFVISIQLWFFFNNWKQFFFFDGKINTFLVVQKRGKLDSLLDGTLTVINFALKIPNE